MRLASDSTIRIAVADDHRAHGAHGLAYPLAITAMAQVALPVPGERQPDRARRPGDRLGADRPELHRRRGTSTRPSRPSTPTTRRSTAYNAADSAGSNLGPTNQKLIDTVAGARGRLPRGEGLAADAPVPVDAVTASASGLDPHITPANARDPGGARGAARGLHRGAGAARSWISTPRGARLASSASRASTCCG